MTGIVILCLAVAVALLTNGAFALDRYMRRRRADQAARRAAWLAGGTSDDGLTRLMDAVQEPDTRPGPRDATWQALEAKYAAPAAKRRNVGPREEPQP